VSTYEHLPLGVEHLSSLLDLLGPKDVPDRIAGAVTSVGSTTLGAPILQPIAELELWLREGISRELEGRAGLRYWVDVVRDPDWGLVCVVKVEANAREALELNLRLQERFPGIPVVVRWTGATDVSEEELEDYLVEIVTRGGLRARAPPGFDAVEAVREVRGG